MSWLRRRARWIGALAGVLGATALYLGTALAADRDGGAPPPLDIAGMISYYGPLLVMSVLAIAATVWTVRARDQDRASHEAALEKIRLDHAAEIRAWNEKSLEKMEKSLERYHDLIESTGKTLEAVMMRLERQRGSGAGS